MEYSGTDGTFYVLRNQAIKFVTFVGVALVRVQRCGNSGPTKIPSQDAKSMPLTIALNIR